MPRKLFAFFAACVVLNLPACSEKSAAELAEEERKAIREKKGKEAAQIYQMLAKEFPDDPRAAEAKQKAAALEAAGPKKE